jgi:hypothetical protein
VDLGPVKTYRGLCPGKWGYYPGGMEAVKGYLQHGIRIKKGLFV